MLAKLLTGHTNFIVTAYKPRRENKVYCQDMGKCKAQNDTTESSCHTWKTARLRAAHAPALL